MTEANLDQEVEETTSTKLANLASTSALGLEWMMRHNEEASRHTAHADLQDAREQASRREALIAAARADISHVMTSTWIDTASISDIVHAYDQTSALAAADQHIAEAKHHIEAEVRNRYGVDINRLTTGEQLAQALQREADDTQRLADQQRQEADRLLDQADELEAHMNPKVQEDGSDQEAQLAAVSASEEAAYDSAERYAYEARQLRDAGLDQESVDNAIRVKLGHATPPSEAAKEGKQGSHVPRKKAAGQTRNHSRTRFKDHKRSR
ncbi:hypothetical protein [Bifidobacterium xylocopae]|uniref:Uncharacterized protein n=1 Tax=Bifidobacterium xylocopae TaxID=2493119 RepID=A0A366KE15_9BIFI|nr:hypothetical protein [Bifidobacterium xylocopae]RBP98911.1 hypothetical protein CRD59_06650 [Bifidobacterium xylocopae]